MISVQEMLALPVFLGSSILAGQRGLCRKIKYIDVLEVPDIENWLAPNQFFLTTAFALKGNIEVLNKLIKLGSERNIAGFAIKLGRFIDAIPASVIETANSCLMPIITLPIHVPYRQIIKDVTLEIMKSEENLKKGLTKCDIFSQVIDGDVEVGLKGLESYGWEKGKPVRIGLLVSPGGLDNDDVILLCNLLWKVNPEFILAPRHQDIVILSRDLPIVAYHNTHDFLENQLKLTKCKDLLLGLSEPQPLTKYIRHCLNEAKTSVKLAMALGYKSGIISFSQVKILSNIIEQPQLKDLLSTASCMLYPLLEYDTVRGTKLFETLKVFLESGRNQHITSSLLNIHRNTLRYRLKQIEDLLGYKLLDSRNIFTLWLAVFVYSMFQNENAI